MRTAFFTVLAVSFATALPVAGQDYKVEKIDSPPPAEGVSAEIRQLLAPTGFKLVRGESRVIAELWLVKELPIAADAKTGPEVLYPLTPGQLVGIAHYPRKATDFRFQDIPAGVYTVRYGHQPVDGAHVGTSPTRDFLVLVPAEKDQSPAPLAQEALVEGSLEATGTAHPGILSLQRVAEEGESLSVREDSDHEWVIVRFAADIDQGGAKKKLPMELVLVGYAAE
jgi:hypothetical protein